MDQDTLFRLYNIEREYQRRVFGEYSDIKSFNLASFISFLEVTLEKAKHSYVDSWSRDLPPWLLECSESNEQGTAPVRTYEYLIKVMALAGAALETYTNIDPDEWRKDGIKGKWQGGE